MGFDVSDLDVDTVAQEGAGLCEHAIGFAYAGTHADVDFEFSSSGLTDQVEEVLDVVFFFSHEYC